MYRRRNACVERRNWLRNIEQTGVVLMLGKNDRTMKQLDTHTSELLQLSWIGFRKLWRGALQWKMANHTTNFLLTSSEQFWSEVSLNSSLTWQLWNKWLRGKQELQQLQKSKCKKDDTIYCVIVASSSVQTGNETTVIGFHYPVCL